VDYRIRIGERVLRVQTPPGEVHHKEGANVSLYLPSGRVSIVSVS
jgi:hypothetical protein